MGRARFGWTLAMIALPAALGASVGAARLAVGDEERGNGGPGTGIGTGDRRQATGDRRQATGGPVTGRVVMIDPGHGGSNTGAKTVRDGVYEKDLTLVLAREVGKRLEAGGVEVKYTRERDEYVSLRERVARANASGAVLFVSVHGNASEAHSQHGFETYVLTAEAMDVDARALRMQDGPRRDGDEEIAVMLDDVERGLSAGGAARMAAAMQAALEERRGAGGNRGVRQSSMDVLLGANMPAVLVEVGFIDHPIEGPEMLDPAVLGGIADAIAQATLSSLE